MNRCNMWRSGAYGQDASFENDTVETQRPHIFGALMILMEGSEIHKHVVWKNFAFLAYLLSVDVFRRERVDAKNLINQCTLDD